MKNNSETSRIYYKKINQVKGYELENVRY